MLGSNKTTKTSSLNTKDKLQHSGRRGGSDRTYERRAAPQSSGEMGRHSNVDDMRKDIDDLKVAVRGLTMAMEHVKDALEAMARTASNSVHIRVVAMMFGIIVMTVTGIEGAQWFFKSYLPAQIMNAP